MGAYLSEPKTTKDSSDTEGIRLRCGASSMQGWRISQEDAHNCILDFDKESSLFAVYDGHGGHEVAEYCSKHLPDFIKKMENYTKGEFEQALKDAFLEFDATLTTADVVEALKTIAGRKDDYEKGPGCGTEGDSESEEEEAIDNLVQEAHMPLDEVMAKYAAAGPLYRVLKGEGGKPPVSPMLRGRRTCDGEAGGSGSSSSGGSGEPSCSSSSSPSSSSKAKSSAKGDAEVSSSSSGSSQPAPLCNGEAHTNGEVEDDADEVTGNQVKAEKPESSAEPSTPGKSDKNEAKSSKTEADSSEVANGETHDVSSSSEADAASSSPTSRKKRLAASVYQKLLQDESESEEEDETFTADAVESDDSDDAGEDVEDKEDDEEEEDSSMEDEEEEEDEEYPGMEVKEEPGSDSGCTAVVALLAGDKLFVANAGDSRCVLCRDGKAVELSVDHKPEDEPERERIENAGGKVTCDGRVNGGLNLSRAIGDHSYKQVKLLPASKQMITALPDIQTLTVNPETDDFMVLACDGIWNSMTSQEVVDFVRVKLEQKTERLSQICEELFDQCLAPNTAGDGTGCDNMTCVIVQFKRPGANNKRPASEETEEPSAKKTKVEEEVTST